MTEFSLSNRHIVVTGGLGVLGRAVGVVLAEHGACVVLLDRAPAHDVPGMAAVMATTFGSFFAMSVTVRPKRSEQVGVGETSVEPSSTTISSRST